MELNPNQKKAVESDNNIYLTACPGSGKTRTLTEKIIRELKSIEEENKFVIGITYTNNAADEIKIRIDRSGVSTDKLWLGTIHSFCMKWILRPYHIYIPNLKYGFRLLNAYDSNKIVAELCAEYNNSSPIRLEPFDFSYYANVNGDFKIKTYNSNKLPHAKNILSKYFEILIKNRQVDFEQILGYSLRILRENKPVGKILSNLFSWILVDEFQDTKEIQYHILSCIIEQERNRLFIVGDPNQCIFSNLGGYPMEKEELENLCQIKLERIELDLNYRSSAKIVEYGNFFQTIGQKVHPVGEHKDYPSKVSHNMTISKDNIIDEIVRLIGYNINDLGILPNEICVIAPQWTHLGPVTRQLMSRLPKFHFNGPGIMPFSRDIDNFWFKITKLFLIDPHPNNYIRRRRWASEVLSELRDNGIEVSHINTRSLLSTCNIIRKESNEENGLAYLENNFASLCDSIGITIESSKYLSEHLNSFIETTNQRQVKLKKDGVEDCDSLNFFIRCINPNKGITIATCHGVKGAEFDTVIAYSLLHDYIPHYFDENGLENSKKLLYVIASRAKKNLHLISEAGRKKGRDGSIYRPTSHLLDYEYLDYDVIEW